ncbi:hypothetical protein T07_14719 [Trichinella nelsoni]|uniref:Uncharacterized protein n=1 Tax=Trichinella nelsoni TaxID=6336 RepID=A0A0V0RDD9_9BILA|nr:hypothetical protein T07_14719 [Trichinella nelsoni]
MTTSKNLGQSNVQRHAFEVNSGSRPWSQQLKIQKRLTKCHCLSLTITKSFDVEAIHNCFKMIREVGLFIKTKNTASLTRCVKRDAYRAI